MNIHEFENELESEEQTDILLDEDESNKIVVYNDEYNTFDHVINCLVNFCDHTVDTANNCAMVIHTVGKETVKEGSETELDKICELLCVNGLDAKLEKNE